MPDIFSSIHSTIMKLFTLQTNTASHFDDCGTFERSARQHSAIPSSKLSWVAYMRGVISKRYIAARFCLVVFVCALAVSIAKPVCAQQMATPINGDTRLVTFDFDPDVTYLILPRPKSVTNIILSPGEKVVSLVAGDTVNFTFQVSASREHIFIKPKFEGMTTSASLETTKANYQFVLRSVGETAKWHQRVTWNNPDMVLVDVATRLAQVAPSPNAVSPPRSAAASASDTGLPIDKLNFNYVSTGDEQIKPSEVFDDGIRTYFRMSASMPELPALFGLKENDATLVNYTTKNGYLIAQGVDGAYMLKVGKQEVQIRKNVKRSFFGTLRDGN